MKTEKVYQKNPPYTLQIVQQGNKGLNMVDNRPSMVSQAKTIKQIHQSSFTGQRKKHEKSLFDGNVVQLKTGFEMELHVPVYGTPPSSREPQIEKEDNTLDDGERKAIKMYLGGGLIYGRNYGTNNEDLFDITADHGADKIPHGALIEGLKTEGYIAPFLYRSMTNIEYRTPPIEEREKGANDKMLQIAKAVEKHASDVADKSTKGKVADLDVPAIDLHTGIPVDALKKMANNNDNVKKLVDDAHESVSPFVYFQTNTGALPSEIPTLFRQASEQIKTVHPETSPQLNAIKKMLDESVNIAESISGDLKAALVEQNNWPDWYTPDSDLKSLTGWVTLVTQYLLGYF